MSGPTVHPARECRLRVALLPWMVAGVRTQYENLRLVDPPAGVAIDVFPIVPYQEGGLIERLPVLRSSQKGTLRSTTHALPLLTARPYDALWTQALLPLLPLLAASDARLKRGPRPAIVYTIDTTPALMDLWTPIYYGRPPAGHAKRVPRDALHRYALHHCTAVTPWSRWAARSFIQDYGVPENRVRVLPPGVDIDAWSVPAHRASAGVGDSSTRPYRLLFVGADFARKGGPLLLDVYHRHLRGTCELHLVTRELVAEEPGVRVYRDFGPNAPGLRALYERCDALVLPTRADCFSLASIEAMACGLPVVSCPVGGIPEIVRHGETGLLAPPDDGVALLAAIEAFVGDPARAARMGLAGRRAVEERFDNRRNTAALFALLEQVGRR